MTDGPKRIQLSRKKGWRKPAGAIVVARPSKWGNEWTMQDAIAWEIPKTERQVWLVKKYREDLWVQPWWTDKKRDLSELRGHDLACWCPLDQPCHADVLLEVANAPDEEVNRARCWAAYDAAVNDLEQEIRR